MRRTDTALVCVLIAFGAFIAYEAFSVNRPANVPAPAPAAPHMAAPSTGETRGSETGEVAAVAAVAAPLPVPDRDINAIRQFLQAHERGTFIGEILAARDSNLARWPDRPGHPVPVWIDERSPLAGPDQALASNVRRAIADWGQAGVPVAFTYTGTASAAEVTVTFVDHFDRAMSGVTQWTRDANGWIVGGKIELSLRSGAGRLLNNEQLYAIALHEVGHLLGLDHTADTSAIMAPHVRALALTPADVATMRLIYELPPGSVKAIRHEATR